MSTCKIKVRSARITPLATAAALGAFALIAAPGFAQDEAPGDRAELVEEVAPRDRSEAEDPMVSREVDRLDEAGLIERQSRIGEDILVLDREIRRAEAVKALVAQMGYEAFLSAYPDLAAAFAESPILLQAEIDRLELLRTLERARSGEPEAEARPARTTPRDDGGDFFRIPSPPAAEEAPVEVPVDASRGAPSEGDSPAMSEDRDIPISLREIYGSSGRFFAIIAHGAERIRVEAGDELPGETLIEAVGENWVDVKRRGETVRIFIRG
jgi:hypothetical protein